MHALLNLCCGWERDPESIFRAGVLKIVLQHNRGTKRKTYTQREFFSRDPNASLVRAPVCTCRKRSLFSESWDRVIYRELPLEAGRAEIFAWRTGSGCRRRASHSKSTDL